MYAMLLNLFDAVSRNNALTEEGKFQGTCDLFILGTLGYRRSPRLDGFIRLSKSEENAPFDSLCPTLQSHSI